MHSMTNERLNSIMPCVVHKEILEEIDYDEVINQFILRYTWLKYNFVEKYIE